MPATVAGFAAAAAAAAGCGRAAAGRGRAAAGQEAASRDTRGGCCGGARPTGVEQGRCPGALLPCGGLCAVVRSCRCVCVHVCYICVGPVSKACECLEVHRGWQGALFGAPCRAGFGLEGLLLSAQASRTRLQKQESALGTCQKATGGQRRGQGAGHMQMEGKEVSEGTPSTATPMTAPRPAPAAVVGRA